MPPDPEPGAMEHGLSTLQFICLPTVRMYVHIHIHDYTDPAWLDASECGRGIQSTI